MGSAEGCGSPAGWGTDPRANGGWQDPGDALLTFLTVAADQRQQHDMAFLVRVSASSPALAELRGQFLATVSALVRRAQESGAVREDITGMDVVLLMCAPTHVVEQLPDAAPDLWKRYLAMIFDGLRPAGAHALPAVTDPVV